MQGRPTLPSPSEPTLDDAHYLLVADEEVLAQSILSAFASAGLHPQPHRATSRPTALHFASLPHMQLAVISLAEPARDGLPLLAEMAAQRPTLPIIFVIIDEDVSLRVRAIESGATEVIARQPEDAFRQLLPLLFRKNLPVERPTLAERGPGRATQLLGDGRFRRFFEYAPVYCYMVAPNGEILDVNQAALDALGYAHNELVSQPISTIYAPESQAAIQVLLQRWRSGEDIRDEELIIQTKGGDKRSVLLSAGRVNHPDDRLAHSISVQIDITARRTSEEKFRRLVQSSHDAIRLIDSRGRIVEWNPASETLTGIPRQEAIGQYLWDVIYGTLPYHLRTPGYYDHIMRQTKEYLQAGQFPAGEDAHLIQGPDNSLRTVQTTVFPIDTNEERFYGGITHDITPQVTANRALRKSEEFFRQLFDGSPVPAAIMSPDLRFWRANDALCLLTGHNDTELRQLGYLELTHPEDRQREQARLKPLLDGQELHYDLEKRFITREGAIVWTLVSVGLVRDEHGQPQHLLPIIQDITRLKEMQQRLYQSENLYRTLISASPDAITVTDRQGTITFISDKTREVYGLDANGDAVGKKVMDFIDQEDQIRAVANMLDAMAGKNHPNNQYRLLRKDGSPFYGEINSAPMLDDAGRPTGLVSITRDVTERRMMEVALQRSEERYRQVVENSPNPIFAINRTGQIQTWNPASADLLGYGADEICETTYTRLLANPTEIELVEKMVQKVFAGNAMRDVELTFHCRDGNTFLLDSRLYPLYDHDGRVNACVFDNTDVTARKQAEKHRFELALERERTRLLSQFIQDVSHEFRTLLSIIGTDIYLLQKANSEDRRQRYADSLQRQTANILTLVEALSTMAKLDNQVPFRRHPVEINTVIHDLLVTTQSQLEQANLALDLHLASPLPRLTGDNEWLSIALGNILNNAIRYNLPGGRISIHSQRDHNSLVITIQDTGIGMNQETELPNIFKRFYRVDQAHSTRGFGLGLPIAQKIIERHHGHILVESAPGKGSTFRILLPLNALPE